MLFSAQRVLSASGVSGINIYAYSHMNYPIAGITWSAPDPAYIAAHAPGNLLFTILSQEPRNGHVLSYLDIVVHDGIAPEIIYKWIEAGAASFPAHPTWPLRWWTFELGMMHDAARLLRDRGPGEFRELKDQLLLAVASVPYAGQAACFVPRAPAPIRIIRDKRVASYSYQLDGPSLRHVTDVLLQFGRAPPKIVNVPMATAHFFASLSGATTADEEAARVLTQMTLAQIDAFAGAIMIDRRTSQSVWKSPALRT